MRALLFFPFFVLVSSLFAACEIKDSAFSTKVRSTKLWNQKFSVPSYNIAGGDTARFAVITDSHQNYADLRATIKYINNSGVQFTIHTGDFTDFASSDEYGLFMDYIKDFDRPLYVVPGNHDLTAGGIKRYEQNFGPQNRSVTTDFGELIFWNNNKMETGYLNFDFLDAAVTAADPAKPVFLFHHQDPYNSLPFTSADNARYTSILQSHPEVVVLHGHLHRFASQTLNSIPFFQINRTEGEKWALVEVDNSEVRIYYCTKKNCSLVSTL